MTEVTSVRPSVVNGACLGIFGGDDEERAFYKYAEMAARTKPGRRAQGLRYPNALR